MWAEISAVVSALLTVGYITVAILVALDVLFRKREVPVALGWLGLVTLAPLTGVILYLLFGINRISRRASRVRSRIRRPAIRETYISEAESITLAAGRPVPQLVDLAQINRHLARRSLLAGNRVQVYDGGDAAYPAMIDAIRNATSHVHLSTYIFDRGEVGDLFVDALAAARERGVTVRVLIDGVGVNYSFPSITSILRSQEIETAVFLPTFLPWSFQYANLRNHRKLLICDGSLGFTGGLNIRDDCWLSKNPSHPTRDVHFRLEGPVVAHLHEAFAIDWTFATRETISSEILFPDLDHVGPVHARGIPDGPDEEYDRIRMVFLAAIDAADKTLRIMTPYFLPDPTILTALHLAVLRGVKVEIVLPRRSNLRFVHWAMVGSLPEVLHTGAHIYRTGLPFDHSKLMVVDDFWTCFGSANWDPRSLRLNFEFNVEAYDQDLAAQFIAIFEDRKKEASRLTMEELDSRNKFYRIRDNIARLATPYL